MKILVVPSFFITNYKSRELYRKINFIKNILKLNIKSALYSFNEHLLSAEILFYSEIGSIIGEDNFYILGDLYDEYKKENIPLNTPYPSLHNKKINRNINFREAITNIKNFDYIVVGINSGNYGKKIKNLGIRYQIPVTIIDYFDHIFDHSSYDNKILFKELEYKKDFNLFFKHDLPKNRQDEIVKPLAPMPCEPKNYLIPNVFDKSIDIFFRGRNTPSAKKDRIIMLQYLKKNFSNISIDIFDNNTNLDFSHFDYSKKLSQSIIAFSPSGKTWDSTRHTETGLFGCIPLIPRPDIDIVGNIDDMYNCLMYDPNKLESSELEKLQEKIAFVLKDKKTKDQLSKKWMDTVLEKHTLVSRSKYLVKELTKIKY